MHHGLTHDIAEVLRSISGANLVGGEWVRSDGPGIPVLDPSTETPIASVPRGQQSDIDTAVQAASDAFPVWRDMNPARRAELMRAWGDLCNANADTISTLESMEVGRIKVGPSIVGSRLIYRSGQADKLTGTTLPASHPDNLALMLREPFGVCGVIVPWNVPSDLMINDVAPALAAGNTVVVKPAEDAPLTCMYVLSLAKAAGIPDGVVNLVNGYGSEAGAALASHPGVRHLSFTGSPETGTAIMAACAKNLVPVRLELGGKSPQIVFEDADLEKAFPAIVRGIVNNAGQVCSAGSRLLVHESIRTKVVAEIARRMDAMTVGAWHDKADMGPLVSAKQRERVNGYVSLGIGEGARLATRRDVARQEGYFVRPTLFDAVEPGMRIAQEEVFGPVLSVVGFRDAEEALRIANGTRYGLVTSIWTQNITRAVQLAKRAESGLVYINTYAFADAVGASFGGYRQSGFGRSMGIDAVLEYTQTKSIIINAQGSL